MLDYEREPKTPVLREVKRFDWVGSIGRWSIIVLSFVGTAVALAWPFIAVL